MISTLEAVIIGNLVTDAIAKAAADGKDITGALRDGYPMLLQKAMAARLLASEHLVPDSEPSAVRRNVAAGAATAKAQAEVSAKWSGKVENSVAVGNARSALEKNQKELAAREDEVARLTKANGDATQIIQAEGAQSLWADRVAAAERTLAALVRKGARL